MENTYIRQQAVTSIKNKVGLSSGSGGLSRSEDAKYDRFSKQGY